MGRKIPRLAGDTRRRTVPSLEINVSHIRLALVAALAPALAMAAPFGHPGGPLPQDLDAVYSRTRQDAYDLEVMLSFGTSRMGSGGHIALAIRDAAPDGDDLVYSANFYADRKPEHAEGHYTDELMARIPKKEYLYGTSSSLGPKASFGLDFGEVYKRSVVGIRISGVPPEVKTQLATFWDQLNADYRANKQETDYHDGPITYSYMNLNCAKTVALGFRYGAGMKDVRIKGTGFLSRLNPVAPLKANVPMETAMEIIEAAARRGWPMDAVLYKKFDSDYVASGDETKTPFAELPDRFPSMLSLDYNSGQGSYEDFDNLRAMHLLFDLGRYSLKIDPATTRLVVEKEKSPEPFDVAEARAVREAKKERKHILRRLLFRAWGLRIGADVDNRRLYNFDPATQEP
jgi:hypothetical protein